MTDEKLARPIQFERASGTWRLVVLDKDVATNPMGWATEVDLIAALLANAELRMQVLPKMPEWGADQQHALLYFQMQARAEAAEAELAKMKTEGAALVRLVTAFDAWLGGQAEYFVGNPQVSRTFRDVAAELVWRIKAIPPAAATSSAKVCTCPYSEKNPDAGCTDLCKCLACHPERSWSPKSSTSPEGSEITSKELEGWRGEAMRSRLTIGDLRAANEARAGQLRDLTAEREAQEQSFRELTDANLELLNEQRQSSREFAMAKLAYENLFTRLAAKRERDALRAKFDAAHAENSRLAEQRNRYALERDHYREKLIGEPAAKESGGDFCGSCNKLSCVCEPAKPASDTTAKAFSHGQRVWPKSRHSPWRERIGEIDANAKPRVPGNIVVTYGQGQVEFEPGDIELAPDSAGKFGGLEPVDAFRRELIQALETSGNGSMKWLARELRGLAKAAGRIEK